MDISSSLAGALDLDRYPLDRDDSPAYRDLVARCRVSFADAGLFDLPGLVRPAGLEVMIDGLRATIDENGFTHRRAHNIYFDDDVPGLAADHPALRRFETSNRTICADQMRHAPLVAVYEWAPLQRFIADVLGAPELHVMDDPLARVNVMSYRAGEALNWHFDRAEFTTTLLLQQPHEGGVFEYRSDLRCAGDPNYDGVGRLVAGLDPGVRRHRPTAGTLTVFSGHDTAHRVTETVGDRDRLVAVFSYYDRPCVTFGDAERLGFYGRSVPRQ